ncbi:hypothetical protein J5N97_013190 [Dioscorea zingiberensis]|uniref:NADP-dependent oxidoreductase domain-containing protein n=1 Tax=Dioscorea zingiberensis TaxID=325984 RepID=A0A9D5HIE5_9LILI|nr:hypothetical protein J5N97_013190 [Dioscorea zingiberensis]
MEKNESKIPRVKLGTQGLEVSKLGFGCMGLSGAYNSPLPEEEGIAILKHAFNQGITFFDTSNGFEGVAKRGDTIGNKVRACEGETWRYWYGGEWETRHKIDQTVPIEKTIGELKKLVEEGKVKYIGLSEANPDTIRRAHAVHPISSVQMEWSLWTRDLEEEIVPLCRELGIYIEPYNPLGRGFFGGKGVVESLSENTSLVSHPRFIGENLEKNKALYVRVENLAKKHQCSPAQLALAWVLHKGDDVVPIPGTTKIKNLDSNIGALQVKLTKEDMKEISVLVPEEELRDYDMCIAKNEEALTVIPTLPSAMGTWQMLGRKKAILILPFGIICLL